jgi:hypothetical protein
MQGERVPIAEAAPSGVTTPAFGYQSHVGIVEFAYNSTHSTGIIMGREMDQSDLRRHRLRLTGDGRAVKDKARRLLSDAYDVRLRRLSQVERDHFAALLAKLLE